MTDKVHPSFDRTQRAREVSAAIGAAGTIDGWVVPSDTRLVEDSEGDVASGSLNAFAWGSPSGLDIEVDTGEAIVRGAYIVRDTTTTVTLDDDTTTTVYLGWQDSATDTIVIGPDGDFSSVDPKIEIYEVTTSGGEVDDFTDLRNVDDYRVRGSDVEGGAGSDLDADSWRGQTPGDANKQNTVLAPFGNDVLWSHRPMSDINVFEEDGTFTISDQNYHAQVMVVGAGGNGGDANAGEVGGGGGGGGFACALIESSSSPESFDITVGTNPGEDTVFGTSDNIIVASGGSNAEARSRAQVGADGGSATIDDSHSDIKEGFTIDGEPGDPGIEDGDGAYIGGTGGSSQFGSGGKAAARASSFSSWIGKDGAKYGGGGGGGATGKEMGSGAQGVVIVIE